MEEFATLFDDQQRLAGEQLQAAWQLHVDRVAETLESGWRENIVRVIEQRFASLKEEMGTANALYLLTAVEARVSEQMDEQWRNGLNEAVEERLQQKLQESLSEEFQSRVETAVAERLDSDVATLVESQLSPRVEAALEDRVAQRLSEELPRLIEEHTQARLADQLPERVDAAVAQRLAIELPQRLSETLALRLAEEVPARLAEEKANLIAWEKANWDAEFAPKLEEARELAREQARIETADKTRDAARRELGLQLSQSLRMIRSTADATEWKEALLDAVQPHAALAALFLVTQDRFSLEGVRGMAGELETGLELEFHEALAFENALESKDLVVAFRSDAEVSPYVISLRPDASPTKCFIYPVTTADNVAALLYVEPGEQPLEVGAVEILVTAAGLTLQSIRGTRAMQNSSLVNIASALNRESGSHDHVVEAVPAMAGAGSNGTAPAAALPERSFNWDQLSQEQREMHMRAQRFARVQVAEMRLYKDEAVKGGRRDGNIYLRLKSEIDEARERYLSQFLDGQAHMRDYLHAELVETLAIDHPQLMGPDYPGSLAY